MAKCCIPITSLIIRDIITVTEEPEVLAILNEDGSDILNEDGNPILPES